MSVEVKPKSYSFATYAMKISSAYLANGLSHPDHMEAEPRQKKELFIIIFFLLNAKLFNNSYCMMWGILQIEDDVIHLRTFTSAEVDDIFRDLHDISWSSGEGRRPFKYSDDGKF